MSGTTILGALFRVHAPVVRLVPAQWIKAGSLPEGVILPALLLRTISVVDRQPLKRGATVRSTARISATVRAASYRDQEAVIGAVRGMPIGFVGDVAGALRVSVTLAGLGPDVRGPGNSFEQTQDFRVSFDA